MSLLALNGIVTPKHFLLTFPRAYEDRRHLLPLSHVVADGKTTQVTRGKLMSKKTVYRGGKQIVVCEFRDDYGMVLTASFFSVFATKSLMLDTWYLIIAKIKNFR
jgi:RecG-like helicase